MSATQHGTDACYRKGCRCVWCVEVARQRARDYRTSLSLARSLGPAPAFYADAKCRSWDPDIFYPQTNSDRAWARAEAACNGCPVAKQCLDWAVATGETQGVWGGLRPAKRRRLVAARLVEAAQA